MVRAVFSGAAGWRSGPPARWWLFALLLAVLPPTAGLGASSLDDLRTLALELVNGERRQRNLAPLERNEDLTEAAQHHAEDMLSRDYFAHESPEGETVLDRFVAAGGNQWVKVAENIARCTECSAASREETVRRFHGGWMDSARHRANILDPELRSFGFSIVARNGRRYAVQTFAGPGCSRMADGAPAEPLPRADRAAVALDLINRVRQANEVPPLQASPALTTAAETLLQSVARMNGAADVPMDTDALYRALPEPRQRWHELAVIAATCGGCGTRPTEADIRFFEQTWTDNPEYRSRLVNPDYTHLGFALTADGQGRKTALAVFGRRD